MTTARIYSNTLEKKKKKCILRYMSCSHPLVACKVGVNPETGKSKLYFPKHVGRLNDLEKLGFEPVLLPCGKCEACLLAKRKEWMVRCYCESLYHQSNCFLTLTYDDLHLPKSLIKKDLQDFIKSIRNDGFSVRYFACGEYGSLTSRPHYHLILFGFCPSDIVKVGKSGSGQVVFKSDYIDSIWKKGLCTVGLFEAACAGYVAGYTSKKLSKKDGFLLMSKKPGLGYQYFVDHAKELSEGNPIFYGAGKFANSPRFFEKVAESLNLDLTQFKLDKQVKADEVNNDILVKNQYLFREDIFTHAKYKSQKKIKLLKRSL